LTAVRVSFGNGQARLQQTRRRQHVQRQLRAANVLTVENAGVVRSKILHI